MITIEDLNSLEQESIKRGIPIIGREKATWLLEILNKYHPQNILELGTANGYSGVILASRSANLTTIEKNPDLAKEAEQNFKKCNLNVTSLVGDGVEYTKQQAQIAPITLDLIFIDFAKHKYIKVLASCLTLLKPGALLIADNISHPHCQNFKEAILNHPLLQTTIIPIKDGLSLSIKIKEIKE